MRILQSFPDDGAATNPYLLQLSRSLAPHVDVLGFSWARALTGRYDVFHAHWPETLIRGRSPTRRLAKRLLLGVLLTRLRFRHVAIVRTVHNPSSHESGTAAERRLLARFDRSTVLWIRLNPTTTLPEQAAVHTIEHGDYSAWFAPYPRPNPAAGRLLYFGLIRPYKEVAKLVSAFSALPDREPSAPLTLHIVGQPRSAELAASIAAAARADARVSLNFNYVADAVLAAEIGSAELVVLAYRDMHNSGAALLALSLGRPVLVPSTPATDLLRAEMGAEWVLTYEGELSPTALADGLQRVRRRPDTPGPNLAGRNWDDIARRHVAAYRAAADSIRRHRSPGTVLEGEQALTWR